MASLSIFEATRESQDYIFRYDVKLREALQEYCDMLNAIYTERGSTWNFPDNKNKTLECRVVVKTHIKATTVGEALEEETYQKKPSKKVYKKSTFAPENTDSGMNLNTGFKSEKDFLMETSAINTQDKNLVLTQK